MHRRQFAAAAGALLTAGCLGDTGTETAEPTPTPTREPTPTACSPPDVIVANGRTEATRATVLYVSRGGEAVWVEPVERTNSNDYIVQPPDSVPDVERVGIVDGRRGPLDAVVTCAEFPDEPLRVYLHPAGDLEVRNRRTG